MKTVRLNIENQLIMLNIIVVAFWLLAILFLLNARNQVRNQQILLHGITEVREQTTDLAIKLLSPDRDFSETGQQEALLDLARKLEAGSSGLKIFGEHATDRLLSDDLIELALLSREINKDLGELLHNGAGFESLPDDLIFEIDRLSYLSSKLTSGFQAQLSEKISARHAAAILIMVSGLLLISAFLMTFTFRMGRSVRNLLHYVEKLGRGEIPEKLEVRGKDEAQVIARHLNEYTSSLARKIDYLDDLSRGNFSSGFKTAAEDKLGAALIDLENKLRKAEEEEKNRLAEEKRRIWNSEGLALFGEILRSERENVSALSFNIIQNLVNYLRVEMGTIFISGSDEEGGERYLEIIASYAFDRRKYINKRLKWGEGLPGTCALEKEKIFLTEIPDDYFEISSGLGDSKPRSILLVPLNLEDELFGIIELASVRVMESHEIQFIETLAQSIASTLSAVRVSERTALLLQQSREQAEELLRQDQKMKENMRELELAQNESTKKASEISGILNAINHSSLVAEFGVNGRFSSLNDKFLLLLESPSEQVLGKHHSEFAMVDKYSEEYKNFWSALRQGETLSIREKYKLFSGKELWLQETLTPILNSEGKVYKILDIAVDITTSVVQQRSLEEQSAEIIRQTLELSSLNEAVNSSIIKCELDTDGIITNLNSNFIETSGYNRKELLGRNYRLFLKEQEKEQFELIWQELVKEKTYQGVIRRTKPTGEEVWLMATFSPVKDEEGKIYKIYFLALDITEKRLKYQLLEEANKEIERLRQILSSYTTDL